MNQAWDYVVAVLIAERLNQEDAGLITCGKTRCGSATRSSPLGYASPSGNTLPTDAPVGFSGALSLICGLHPGQLGPSVYLIRVFNMEN